MCLSDIATPVYYYIYLKCESSFLKCLTMFHLFLFFYLDKLIKLSSTFVLIFNRFSLFHLSLVHIDNQQINQSLCVFILEWNCLKMEKKQIMFNNVLIVHGKKSFFNLLPNDQGRRSSSSERKVARCLKLLIRHNLLLFFIAIFNWAFLIEFLLTSLGKVMRCGVDW